MKKMEYDMSYKLFPVRQSQISANITITIVIILDVCSSERAFKIFYMVQTSVKIISGKKSFSISEKRYFSSMSMSSLLRVN